MRSSVRAQTPALLKGCSRPTAVTRSCNPAHQTSDSNRTNVEGTDVRARRRHCATHCALVPRRPGLGALQSKLFTQRNRPAPPLHANLQLFTQRNRPAPPLHANLQLSKSLNFIFLKIFIWLHRVLVVGCGIYFPNQGSNPGPQH